MFFATGIADVALETGDSRYIATANSQWDDVIARNLYITGNIGALKRWEAIGTSGRSAGGNASGRLFAGLCSGGPDYRRTIAGIYWADSAGAIRIYRNLSASYGHAPEPSGRMAIKCL